MARGLAEGDDDEKPALVIARAAKQSRNVGPDWIASSLTLLAMTVVQLG
jgi:hypothetical protein